MVLGHMSDVVCNLERRNVTALAKPYTRRYSIRRKKTESAARMECGLKRTLLISTLLLVGGVTTIALDAPSAPREYNPRLHIR